MFNLAAELYLPLTGFSSYVLAVLIVLVMSIKCFPDLNLCERLCRFIHAQEHLHIRLIYFEMDVCLPIARSYEQVGTAMPPY